MIGVSLEHQRFNISQSARLTFQYQRLRIQKQHDFGSNQNIWKTPSILVLLLHDFTDCQVPGIRGRFFSLWAQIILGSIKISAKANFIPSILFVAVDTYVPSLRRRAILHLLYSAPFLLGKTCCSASAQFSFCSRY